MMACPHPPVHIFPLAKLPDELIMQIFSKITNISMKFRLELVSKIFRYLARKLPSWKGFHELNLDIKPLEAHVVPFGLFKPPCEAVPDWRQTCRINGVAVQFESYLAAVDALLSRMEVKHLSLHVGQGDRDLMHGLVEIFKKHRQRVKVQDIEYHRLSCSADALIIELLQSIPHRIRSFNYIVEVPEDWKSNTLPKVNTTYFKNPYYALQNCSNLQSFTMASYSSINSEHLGMLVASLAGKPLKELRIYNTAETRMSVGQLAQICTKVSGSGVQSLAIQNFTITDREMVTLSYLSQALGPKAAGVLENLSIMTSDSAFNDFALNDGYKMEFKQLPFVPCLFPNLKFLRLDAGEFASAGLDKEIVDSIGGFLKNCQDGTKREIVFGVAFINDDKRVLDDLRKLAFEHNLTVDIKPYDDFGSHVVALSNDYINVSIKALMQIFKVSDDDSDYLGLPSV